MAHSEKDSWLCHRPLCLGCIRGQGVWNILHETHMGWHTQTLISLASVLCWAVSLITLLLLSLSQSVSCCTPHPPLTLTVPEPECYCPSHISFSEPGRSRRSRVLQVTTDSREVKAADSGAERDIQCRDKLAGDDTWHVTYRDNAGSGLGSPDSLTLEPGPAGDSGRLVPDADLGPWGRRGHDQDNQNRSCWYKCSV